MKKQRVSRKGIKKFYFKLFNVLIMSTPENVKFENGKLTATPAGIEAATKVLGGNKELATVALNKYLNNEQGRLDRAPSWVRSELVRGINSSLERKLDEQRDTLLAGLGLSASGNQALKDLKERGDKATLERLQASMKPVIEPSQDSRNTPANTQEIKNSLGGISGARTALASRWEVIDSAVRDAVNPARGK
jgi:hypothetical protein